MNKKIISLFLSIIIVFSMACTANADDAGPVSCSCIINKYSGDGTQEEEKQKYDVDIPDEKKESVREAISEAIKNRVDTVDLSFFEITADLHTGTGPAVDELYALFTDLVNRTPEFYYVFGVYSPILSTYGYVTGMPLVYCYNENDTLEIQREIDRECARILSEITPDMNDLEKALTVHDYFALHYEYDEYAREKGYEECPWAFSMDGLLINKKAVCQGFSLAYMYVLELLGIESTFCPNDKDKHAWNIVKINGNWYHVDVTHDTLPNEYVGWVSHRFFLLSDEEIVKYELHGTWDIETGATYTTYDNYFWRDILSGVFYRDGFWYYAVYADDNDTQSNRILKRNVMSGEVTTILEKAGPWRYFRSNGNIRLFIYGDRIFYNGPYKIYSIDLNGNDRRDVTPTEVASGWTHILGIVKNGKDISYVLYTLDNGGLLGNDIYTIKDCFDDKSDTFFMTASYLSEELTVRVLNNPDMLQGRIFAAVYDNSDSLVNILEPEEITDASVYKLNFTRPNTSNGYIKIMAWDDKGRPLADSFRVNYK